MPDRPILIATRGSALALAQANNVLAQCRAAFPQLAFELKIIKTTGDKLQTASMSQTDPSLPKGLFTKELEIALLEHRADLAVHSLKDLPTDLPTGLRLGAVGKRADVRDVLIYRDADYPAALRHTPEAKVDSISRQLDRRGFHPHIELKDLPPGATIATSSTRRKAQVLYSRPDLNVVEIRGNVLTRMTKLAERPEIDATILALAGLSRLHFRITPKGKLEGDGVPGGLLAIVLEPEIMLPCVGQGAVGIEIRENDERIEAICGRLNDFDTMKCVEAERAFLQEMGGGCQSPVAAYAEIDGTKIRMRAVSFREETPKRGEAKRPIPEAIDLGRHLAGALK